jgi:hypothetical protein
LIVEVLLEDGEMLACSECAFVVMVWTLDVHADAAQARELLDAHIREYHRE